MLRKMLMGLAVFGMAAVISGCGGPKGSAFIGHWVGGTEKTPISLDIKYDDGVYHIDRQAKSPFTGNLDTKRLEATALSDSVLSINMGIAVVNLRMDNGQILMDNKTFTKAAQ